MITLYDLPSNMPGGAWSPTTWRTRYALNYKMLPFETVFIEYRDIEAKCKELGVGPTGLRADGTPRYTVPTIYDDRTKKAITDSVAINIYLDEEYPDTPQLVKPGTRGLHMALTDRVYAGTAWAIPLTMPRAFAARQLTFASVQYIVEHNPGIENILEPQGKHKEKQWAEGELEMARFAAYFQPDQIFMSGSDPNAGDFCIAAALISLRLLLGRDSDGWKRIMSWQGGRWKRLMDALEQYESK